MVSNLSEAINEVDTKEKNNPRLNNNTINISLNIFNFTKLNAYLFLIYIIRWLKKFVKDTI